MKILTITVIGLLICSFYLNIYLVGEHYENKTELIKEVRLKEKAELRIEIIRQLEEDGSYDPDDIPYKTQWLQDKK